MWKSRLSKFAKKLAYSFKGAASNSNIDEMKDAGYKLIAEVSKPTGKCDIDKCLSLVGAGARLDIENDDNETAFLLSAWHGHAEVLKSLAQKGVDPDQTDTLKNTALMLSAEKGYGEIVDFLVNELVTVSGKRPDAEKENYFGDTAYSLAKRNGYTAIAAQLAKRMGSEELASSDKRAKAPPTPHII